MTVEIYPMATLDDLREAYCVHSVLATSWLNFDLPFPDRGIGHDYYENRIIEGFQMRDDVGGVILENSEDTYLQFKLIATTENEREFNDAVCWLFRITKELKLRLRNVY